MTRICRQHLSRAFRSEIDLLEYPALGVTAVVFPNLNVVAVVDVVTVVVDNEVAVDRRLYRIRAVRVLHQIPPLGFGAVVGPQMDIVTVERTQSVEVEHMESRLV